MVLHDLEKAQGKSFDKMAMDMQQYLKDFEKEIRADERRKVLKELVRESNKNKE